MKFVYKTFKQKPTNGMTLVELVIVIAVIAILAAVLIPTFSNIIEKTNNTKLIENAKNKYQMYLIDDPFNLNNNTVIIKENDQCIIYINGTLYNGIYTYNESKDILFNIYNEYIIFEQYNKDNNIIIVKQNENLIQLQEITSINQLQENLKVIIAYEKNNKLYALSKNINNTECYIESIELENGDLTVLLDTNIFSCNLTKNGNWWGFKGENNIFLDSSEIDGTISGNLYFRQYNDVSCITNYQLWDIKIENNETIIKAFLSNNNTSYYLQYNENSSYFKCYPDDNNNLKLYIVSQYKNK